MILNLCGDHHGRLIEQDTNTLPNSNRKLNNSKDNTGTPHHLQLLRKSCNKLCNIINIKRIAADGAGDSAGGGGLASVGWRLAGLAGLHAASGVGVGAARQGLGGAEADWATDVSLCGRMSDEP